MGPGAQAEIIEGNLSRRQTRAYSNGFIPIGPKHLRVILRQGINRQIRRMFQAVGYQVKQLARIRIGNIRLGDLPRGHWRPLTKREFDT